MKVAIIGMGVVGRAQARMFTGHDVITYDITDGVPYPDLGDRDFAVICAGTPARSDGTADLSGPYLALWHLPAGLPVLIRSTMPPHTTDAIQAARPQTAICHAPEFIQERPGGIWRDSTDVPYLILGGTPGSREFFRPRLAEVFPGKIHECSALEAELAKYTANLYWAVRVIFVNEMAGICAALGAQWNPVRDAWLADPRMTPDYTAMDGFPPGFGGRCWPKDLSAFIRAASDAGHEPEFLIAVQEANERFQA
jgi:UDPglucose 6-dehydrogenase